MQLALSNLSFLGFEYSRFSTMPKSLGLELFYEFGTDYYWEKVICAAYSERPTLGLSLHGPCISVNLADPSDTTYLAVYEQVFQFAAKWKAEYIAVHTNETICQDASVARALVSQRLAELLLLAQDYQIQLLIENVGLSPKGNLLFDWPDYQKLLESLPQAGALLDIGHAHINQWQIPSVIDRLGTRIKAYHLHDNQGLGDDHLAVGGGLINWSEVFSAICAKSPDATLVFEYAHGTPEEILQNIIMVNEHYLNLFRQVNSGM